MQTAAVMSTEKHILDEIGEVAVVDTADIERNLWKEVRNIMRRCQIRSTAKNALSIVTCAARRLRKPPALPEKKVRVQREIGHVAKSELTLLALFMPRSQTRVVRCRQE